MAAIALDGKEVARHIRAELTARVARHVSQGGTRPGLAVVLVGSDPASEIYVRNKGKAARAVGMESLERRLPESSTTGEVLAVVEELNQNPAVHGILVQLPLPAGIDRERVIQAIHPAKDVDGLSPLSQGALMKRLPGLRPCTPSGVMDLIRYYDIPIQGQRAVVIGRSELVGLPQALLLLEANATVTVVHSKTSDVGGIVREADIVVAAAGQPHLVRGDWIKPGATVIDVGIHRTEHGIIGDVVAEDVQDRAGYLSPVPGGVGPMTIAELLKNTWEAFAAVEMVRA